MGLQSMGLLSNSKSPGDSAWFGWVPLNRSWSWTSIKPFIGLGFIISKGEGMCLCWVWMWLRCQAAVQSLGSQGLDVGQCSSYARFFCAVWAPRQVKRKCTMHPRMCFLLQNPSFEHPKPNSMLGLWISVHGVMGQAWGLWVHQYTT